MIQKLGIDGGYGCGLLTPILIAQTPMVPAFLYVLQWEPKREENGLELEKRKFDYSVQTLFLMSDGCVFQRTCMRHGA